MAKKKVAAKKAVAKKPAKKAVAKRASRAPAAPPISGQARFWDWEWVAAGKGGGFRIMPQSDQGHRIISLAIDFGVPVESVSARLGGSEVAPKVAGSCVYLRCNGGVVEMGVQCASKPSEPVAEFWEP